MTDETPYIFQVPEGQRETLKSMIEISDAVADFERQENLNALMSFLSPREGYVRPPFIPPVAGVFRLCDSCPCLNKDSEYGSDCNLAYTSKYTKIGETEKENIYKYISSDCKIDHISFEGELIIPKRIELDGKGGFTEYDFKL